MAKLIERIEREIPYYSPFKLRDRLLCMREEFIEKTCDAIESILDDTKLISVGNDVIDNELQQIYCCKKLQKKYPNKLVLVDLV